MSIIGRVGIAFAMSTSKTGASGSEEPAGDIIYFLSEEAEIVESSGDSLRTLGNFQSSKIPTGKYKLGVKLSSVIVEKDDNFSSATETLDEIRDFIRAHSAEVGGSRVYCFLYNNSESSYCKLGWEGSTRVNYLYGRPNPTTWKMGRGSVYTADKFEFWEVTIL